MNKHPIGLFAILLFVGLYFTCDSIKADRKCTALGYTYVGNQCLPMDK